MPNGNLSAPHKHRIPELDYLRGFAAFSVVVFHYFFKGPTEGFIKSPTFGPLSDLAGYGYLGVNLFFIISGFVIAMSLQGATATDFFKARALRLFPAMWVCATVTAIGVVVLTSASFPIGNWLASLALVPNWFGYPGVDSAYWSLRIEVQFYIAVGLFLVIGRYQFAMAAIAVWLAASASNLVFPIWRLDFLLCLTWAPYLCAGMLFYTWYVGGISKLNIAGLLCALLLSIGYGYKSAIKDGYEIPWVSCLIIFMMYAAFAVLCMRKTQFASTAFSCFLGAVTYPLYLLHQTLGYMIFNAIVMAYGGVTNNQSLLMLCGLLFVMIAAAYAIQVGFVRIIDKRLRLFLN